MRIRIYYEDTDCGNVVYYANYLKYMERSRTEFLRERGIDLAAYHGNGSLFAVTEAHIRYKAPARYDDLIDLQTAVTEITGTTILFTTVITRASDGAALVTGDVRLACINPRGRPSRIPVEIRAALDGGGGKEDGSNARLREGPSRRPRRPPTRRSARFPADPNAP